jgi:hypothetical protein
MSGMIVMKNCWRMNDQIIMEQHKWLLMNL